MASKKKIIAPVMFMLLITVLYTSVLAFINESTKGIISEQEQLRIKRSVLYVFNMKSDGTSDEVNQLFDDSVTTEEVDGTTVYTRMENGAATGYALAYTGKGLWGSISGYIGFSPDFTEVLGVDFVAHSETPGLGGRIDEPWFKEQFRGITVDSVETLVIKPSDGGNIDGITGATLTSVAVVNIVNQFIIDTLAFAKEANL